MLAEIKRALGSGGVRALRWDGLLSGYYAGMMRSKCETNLFC